MFDKLKAKIFLWGIKGLTNEDAKVRRIILVHFIANKVNGWFEKQEGVNMDDKPWYKRKTFYTAVIGAVLGGLQPISAALGHPVVVPQWVYEVLGSVGLYCLRDAVSNNK